MAGQGDQISRMGDEEFESDHISRVGKILSWFSRILGRTGHCKDVTEAQGRGLDEKRAQRNLTEI